MDERLIEDVVREHLKDAVLSLPLRGSIHSALVELTNLRNAAKRWQAASEEPAHGQFDLAFARVAEVLDYGRRMYGDSWHWRHFGEDLEHAIAHAARAARHAGPGMSTDAETGMPDLAHAIARLGLWLQREIESELIEGTR